MVIQQSTDDGLRELALFAGVGGGILGGHLLGWRTVCAVERDAYAAQVLAQRQNDGMLRPFPIWSDVATFDGRPWSGLVDVVSGGFPCQDISVAGKGAGITGARSGLWGHMARIIREIRPRFVFVENSPALTTRGLDRVLGDLAEMGFDARWGCISAGRLGANHKRDRIWIVANSNGNRLQIGEHESSTCVKEAARKQFWAAVAGNTTTQANTDSASGEFSLGREYLPWDRNWQIKDLPTLDGAEDGFSHRLDRLKALGNAQVPRVAATAWKILGGHD